MRILFTAILMVLVSSLSAQAEFSFYLKVQDALGNRDSVLLGYDPAASILMDASFGEEDISAQAFNSALEIRSCLAQQPSMFHSKTQIVNWGCNNSLNYLQIAVSIYAKNYPIRLEWDADAFSQANGPCHTWTTMVDDFTYFNFPLPSFRPSFLALDSTRILDNAAGKYNYTAALSDGNNGEVKVMYFAWIEKDITGGGSTTFIQEKLLSAYEINLRNQWLTLTWDRPEDQPIKLELIDLLGRKNDLKEVRGYQSSKLDVSPLGRGTYILQGTSQKGEVFTKKIRF